MAEQDVDPWCDCCSAGNHTTRCRGECGAADECCHPLYHTDPERAERERIAEVKANIQAERDAVRRHLGMIVRMINAVEVLYGVRFVTDDEGWIGLKYPAADVSICGASNIHLDGETEWKVVS